VGVAWSRRRKLGVVAGALVAVLLLAARWLTCSAPGDAYTWTPKDLDNFEHLKNCMLSTQKFAILMEGIGKTKRLTSKDAIRIRELLSEALREGVLVRDEVLAKVHPDFPRVFRETHLEPLRRITPLLLRIIEKGQARKDDLQAIAAQEKLLDLWDPWARRHASDLHLPENSWNVERNGPGS
jgi:hypothetical protein